METQILQYDLLWIQSIPAMANIYYYKYLRETHVLHCPAKDLSIRAVARSIMSTLRAVSGWCEDMYASLMCCLAERDQESRIVL